MIFDLCSFRISPPVKSSWIGFGIGRTCLEMNWDLLRVVEWDRVFVVIAKLLEIGVRNVDLCFVLVFAVELVYVDLIQQSLELTSRVYSAFNYCSCFEILMCLSLKLRKYLGVGLEWRLHSHLILMLKLSCYSTLVCSCGHMKFFFLIFCLLVELFWLIQAL